jgi:hypothetical protein
VIRVRHESLPAGLSAVVRRQPGADTDVVVSTVLSPARQRAAVRAGLRAARPAGRRAVLPVPLLGVLALAWASARAIVKAIHVHPAALVAAAGVVTAAAVTVAVLPHQHGVTGPPAAGGVPAPAPAPLHSAGRPAPSTQPSVGPQPTSQPVRSVVPVADHSPARAGGSAPSPGASPAAAGPLPSPSPTQGGGLCLKVLGVSVCV